MLEGEIMVIEHPLSRAKGKAGLFWVANRAECPVKLISEDSTVLVFINGYVFAHAVGMVEKHGNPLPHLTQAGIKTIIRASQFKKTETIIELCKTEDAPIVIRKYGYEFYVAMAPTVYEYYMHLFEEASAQG